MGFQFRNQVSWVNHQYKLISKDQGETYEWYDLLNDKSEINNIIDQEKEIAETMQMELETWLVSVERSSEGNDY